MGSSAAVDGARPSVDAGQGSGDPSEQERGADDTMKAASKQGAAAVARRGNEAPSDDQLRALYEQMVLIRRFEERAEEQYTRARIGGYLHLAIGEEATVVGAISALQADDYVLSSYRDHGVALARCADPTATMAELFGKETGLAHGRGG